MFISENLEDLSFDFDTFLQVLTHSQTVRAVTGGRP